MITSRQIEAFHAVVSAGSMTAAARLLNRSQPAVSRLILDLEQEIGFILFTRLGSRLAPTKQAIAFYQEVHRSFIGLERIAARAASIAQGAGNALAIAATPAIAAGLLPAAIVRCTAQDPALRFSLRSLPAEEVVRNVVDGMIDLGVATLPLDHAEIRVHFLGQADCVVAVKASDPLARLETVPLSALRDRQVITIAHPFRLRHTIDRALQSSEIHPQGMLETNTSLNAIMAARAGGGVALVDPISAIGIPVRGVAIRPVDRSIPAVWGVITPVANPPAAAASSLIEAIAQQAATLLPGFVRHEASAIDAVQASLYGDTPEGSADG